MKNNEYDDDFDEHAEFLKHSAFAARKGSARKSGKKSRLTIIALLSLGVMVIVFAFIMEAKENHETSAQDGLAVRSAGIQREIEELDWIVPMFLTINEYSRPGNEIRRVNGIVIHNIGNPGTTAVQNRNYFENLKDTGERSASSNFIIDLDGTIIQCVPVNEVAYASNHRNDDTLSIEICHPDDTGKFNDETYAAAVRLTAWLCVKHGLTADDVIRHYDVRPTTDCPRYFTHNEDKWDIFKADVSRAMG